MPTVNILVEWSNFFTVMLMSPDKFCWAKEFLSSKAMHHLEGMWGHIDFSLPKCYPSDTELLCASEMGHVEEKGEMASLTIEEVQEESLSPKRAPKGKTSKGRTPLVDNEVRRSPRIKLNNKGSKPSGCLDKRFLACSPSPPTLSAKVIRNLGMQFCDMNPESLEDDVVKKKKMHNPVIKKQGKKDTSNKGSNRQLTDDDEAEHEGPTGKDQAKGS